MPDPVITNVDLGSVEIRNGEFVDGLVNFTGAGSYPAGTVLAAVGGATTNYDRPGSAAWIPWVHAAAATLDDHIPRAVLTYAVAAAGAGDVPCRVLTSGVVNKDRLLESTPGTSSGANVDVSTVRMLQENGVTALDVTQLAQLDNQ